MFRFRFRFRLAKDDYNDAYPLPTTDCTAQRWHETRNTKNADTQTRRHYTPRHVTRSSLGQSDRFSTTLHH